MLIGYSHKLTKIQATKPKG